MKKYGLIGKKLSYSYSKIIHEYLIKQYNIDANYDLIEVSEVNKELLLDYDGLNITIPYKEEVLKYLDNDLNIPCNTIKNTNNKLEGFNTDIYGIKYSLDSFKMSFNKIVILGSGATSKLIQSIFKDKEVIVISRSSQIYNYEYLNNIEADLLINTTPVGVNEYESIISEELITNYKAIFDVNYNPINSKLGMLAKKNNVKYKNGLDMLIVQAIKSFEIWHDLKVDSSEIKDIYLEIIKQTKSNVALIGMSFSGKSTTSNKFNGVDLDKEIERVSTKSIAAMLEEGSFRKQESKVLKELVDKNTSLIACGGGIILNHENVEILKDYIIVHLDIPLITLKERFLLEDRPLLQSIDSLEKMYNDRKELYTKYSNISLNNEELDLLLK